MKLKPRSSFSLGSPGINLVETLIVLGILGFLSLAVLGAMDIINSVRKRNLISQHDELSVAVTMFHQQASGLPGDENNPHFPSNDAVEGNNDRIISLPDNATGIPDERGNVFPDLAGAGFVKLEPGENYAKNPFGGTVSIMLHALNKTGDARPADYMAFSNVPGRIIAEIDEEQDDGRPDSGKILAGIMPHPEEVMIIGRAIDYNSTHDRENPATLYWLLRW